MSESNLNDLLCGVGTSAPFFFKCTECKKGFSLKENPHASDIKCPSCSVWLEVYEGESGELQAFSWVVGKARDQDQTT